MMGRSQSLAVPNRPRIYSLKQTATSPAKPASNPNQHLVNPRINLHLLITITIITAEKMARSQTLSQTRTDSQRRRPALVMINSRVK
jgi:hypothetical protein